MAADVGGLIADIGLNIAGLREDIKAANNELRRGTAQMNRELGGLSKAVGGAIGAFRGLAGAVGLTFGVGTAVGFLRQQINMADQMLDLTERIGGTTEALSEYEFVAQRSGVAFNTLTMGWQRMTRRIAEAAEGMGEARGALRELGLDARRLAMLSVDEQFETIADRLSQVENESHRVRLAMKLFDSEGVALVQMMGDGADGMRALREEARRLGITLSQEDAEAAARFNDEMDTLGAMARSVGRDLALNLIPPLLDIAQLFLDMDPATSSTAALRAELKQLQDLMNDPNPFKRAGFFKLGGETQFFLTTNDIRKEIARIEGELERRGREAGRNAGTALGEGFGRGVPEGIGLVTKEDEDFLNNFVAGLAEERAREARELDTFLNEFVAELNSPRLSQGQKLSPELSVFIDQLREGERLMMAMRTDAEKQADALREANELYEAGVIDLETLNRLQKSFEDDWENFGKSIGRSFEDSLADAFLGAEVSFGDMLKRMAAQAAASGLLRMIGGLFPAGGMAAKVISFLGFGGGKAEGGPVSAGTAYIVGERGKELFVPQRSGTIVPNHALGGGPVINIGNIVSNDPEEVRRQVEIGVRTAIAVSGAQTEAMINSRLRPSMA